MVKIRAATLFLQPPSWESQALRSYVETRASRFAEVVEDLGLGGVVWSLRLSFPPPPQDVETERLAENITSSMEGSGVRYAAALHLDASDRRARELVDVLPAYPLYSSLRTPRFEDLKPAAKLILDVSRRDPLAAARLAIDLQGSGLLTPYFPLSSNIAGREGLAVALLYADALLEGVKTGTLESKIRETLEWAEGVGLRLSSTLGVEFFGVDASPSPWMDESVARVVEILSGVAIPEPGTFTALRRLNEAVWRGSVAIRSTGFNETMLPVAEDNVLKERVREGSLNVRDLVALTASCVAGVDMVVLPSDTDHRLIEGILADQKTIVSIKGRPLGSRLIVYEGAAPGDYVELGFFGKVPVIGV